MEILSIIKKKHRPRKYMKSDVSLETLLKDRTALKNQISQLKTQYLRRNISGPNYYKKFEQVAMQMIQVNQLIKDELPSFDALNLT